MSLSHLTVDENFNPQVGFVHRTDVKESTAYSHLFIRPVGSAVREYSPFIIVKYLSDQRGRMSGRTINTGIGITMHSGDSFEIAAKRVFDRLDYDFEIRPSITIPAGGYEDSSIYMVLSTDSRRRLSGSLTVLSGDYYGGERTAYSGSINIVPLKYLKIAPSFTREEVSLPDGSFVASLVTTSIEYNISTQAFFNALLQWNDDLDQRSFNIRFNYEYRPNSDIYVVYNEHHYYGTKDVIDRLFVVKLTYLFIL